MSKFLVGTLIVLGVLGVGGFIAYSYAVGMKNEGIQLEGELSDQYSKDQNDYSNYAAGLVEQFGVTDLQKDAVKEVLVAYVSGRKVEGAGQLLNAVQEAVPNLDQSTYTLIINYIQKGREQFKAKQDLMIGKTKNYENWQNEGIVRPIVLRGVFGFPTNRLRATIGTQSVYGQAALDQMRVIVTTSETQKAFQTGTDKPIVAPKQK